MIDSHSRLFSSKLGSPAKIFRKVTHCIFDMDGTLLDTESMYHQMIYKICEKYRRHYTKDMERKLYGGTDRDVCVTVVKELKMPISADEMENQLTNIASKMLPFLPVKEGAERLMRHLHDYKIPLALATNSTEQALRLHVTAKPAIFGMFHHKVSVTDPEVLRGKPHPDLYLVAASRFQDKPKPAKCLVFEDSEKGVTAAKEAGMQVVMIPDLKIDREKTRNATLVIRSLLDFKPELFGLPPFDSTKGHNTTKPGAHKVADKKDSEEKSTKEGNEQNMTGKEDRRRSVYENIIQKRSIRLSFMDKLVGRANVDSQPHVTTFIDNLLGPNSSDKGVTSKNQSKSFPERSGNKKVRIAKEPYANDSITTHQRTIENTKVGQHAERRNITKVFERKGQGTSLENGTPKSVEDQRKVVDHQRQQKSKKQ